MGVCGDLRADDGETGEAGQSAEGGAQCEAVAVAAGPDGQAGRVGWKSLNRKLGGEPAAALDRHQAQPVHLAEAAGGAGGRGGRGGEAGVTV